MAMIEMVRELEKRELLDGEIIGEVIAGGGLRGTDKSIDLEESLRILGKKNDLWMSFESWYGTLGTGERRYLDLVLQAAAVGLAPGADRTSAGPGLIEAEIDGALAGDEDLTRPSAVGPVSTAITRELIKRTIRQNCATRWAGCS